MSMVRNFYVGVAFGMAFSASVASAATTTVLYDFTGAASGDGAFPQSVLLLGPRGALIGTTSFGGAGCGAGCGTVYELVPPAVPGGAWTNVILYAFAGGSADGSSPVAGLVKGRSGVLYGTTLAGGGTGCGGTGCGTVFALTPPTVKGGSWTESVLHKFTGGADGGQIEGPLVRDKTGVLYGTASAGGHAGCSQNQGCGTVFSLTPPAVAGGAWTESTLHTFTGGADGGNPIYAGLRAGPLGTFYGTTFYGGVAGAGCNALGCGTVFKMTPPATVGGPWTHSVVYAFANKTEGTGARGVPVIGRLNVIYGTVSGGAGTGCGGGGCGGIFALTPPHPATGSYTESVVYSFTGGTDGNGPTGALLLARRTGVLYATTGGSGAPPLSGSAVTLTPPAIAGGAWTENTLHTFAGAGDGGFPVGGLVMDKAGVLYGTTQVGGTHAMGTVYAIVP